MPCVTPVLDAFGGAAPVFFVPRKPMR